MSPTKLHDLKTLADLARFDTWQIRADYRGESFTDYSSGKPRELSEGDRVECSASFDDLPEDIRRIVESAPRLIAKLKEAHEAGYQTGYGNAVEDVRDGDVAFGSSSGDSFELWLNEGVES